MGAFIDPDWFIASQIPPPPTTTTATSADANARLVALQLGNLYALLFMLGVAVLHATTELRVVRNYLVAAWVADLGHVALTCYFLGPARSLDLAAWNAVTWGNVGFTVSFGFFFCFSFGSSPSPHPLSLFYGRSSALRIPPGHGFFSLARSTYL